MKNKVLVLLLAALMVISMFAGCSKKADTKQDSSASTALPEQDRSGNKITVPAEVKTIVSMAPSTTEFLIDLVSQAQIDQEFRRRRNS